MPRVTVGISEDWKATEIPLAEQINSNKRGSHVERRVEKKTI